MIDHKSRRSSTSDKRRSLYPITSEMTCPFLLYRTFDLYLSAFSRSMVPARELCVDSNLDLSSSSPERRDEICSSNWETISRLTSQSTQETEAEKEMESNTHISRFSLKRWNDSVKSLLFKVCTYVSAENRGASETDFLPLITKDKTEKE